MDIREILAANIKRLRKTSCFSQEELAARAGIDRTYVSALERRVYAASIDLVARLAEALEVEPDVLLRRPEVQVRGSDKASS
jgi:transcriptional regulator with XRE-family HTH domain